MSKVGLSRSKSGGGAIEVSGAGVKIDERYQQVLANPDALRPLARAFLELAIELRELEKQAKKEEKDIEQVPGE